MKYRLLLLNIKSDRDVLRIYWNRLSLCAIFPKAIHDCPLSLINHLGFWSNLWSMSWNTGHWILTICKCHFLYHHDGHLFWPKARQRHTLAWTADWRNADRGTIKLTASQQRSGDRRSSHVWWTLRECLSLPFFLFVWTVFRFCRGFVGTRSSTTRFVQISIVSDGRFIMRQKVHEHLGKWTQLCGTT